MSDTRLLEYRPAFAPHVIGRYPMRRWDEEAGGFEEQRIDMVCEFEGCGATMRRVCSTGLVRDHIARFALGHLHRDPLASSGNPGSQ